MISYSLHSVDLHATYKLKKMKFCLVLILLILKLTQKGSGQCTQFQFTSQPPTELSCNPYDVRVDPAVWRLRISCDVRRISGTDEFDVHWFHKNNENEIIDLGQVEVQETPNRERIVLGTQRINTPFDESMLGEYWCQVIVTSTQPNTYLGKSDILMIRDPEDYDTLSTCSGIVSVPTSKCADGIVTLQTIQPFTSSSSFSSSPSIFLPSFSSSSFFTSSSSSSFSLLSSSSSFSSSSSSSFSSSSSSSFSSSIKWTVLTYSSSSFTTSSSSSSLLVTHANSQTNIKTYSSIQINTPSMTSDSGLASSHIIVITVTITTIMLGILLVISCFLIVCIKRNKRNKDTIYYLTPDDIITPNPCTQFKTSTPTESVEYVTILLEESNNFTRTPVSDNNHYYSVIHNEIVTSQEESHKSLELSKTPVNESSHYYSVINKDMITTQEEKYKSLESNNTTRAPVSDNNHYYSVINKDMITTQEEKYKSLELNHTTRTPVSDNSHYYNVFNKEIVATQEESYQPLECTTIISENDYTTLMK